MAASRKCFRFKLRSSTFLKGHFVLPERLVHRVELNPETGRAVLFNITTVDPRLQGNIDLQVAGSIEISAKERKLRVAEFEEDDAANAEYDDDGDDDDTGGGGMGGGGDDDGSDRDNYD
ncbi:hypothetical protein M885DRAFT_497242 [Pelagophyceae sp. CCMP2097]|nr:hypothetical protein M885DRAFT_497242 [Pelagophyceae sp. CCMP2097]